VAMTPDLVSKGYGGYGAAVNNSFVYFTLYSPTATYAQANETYRPFFDYALSLAQAGGLTVLNYTIPYPSFASWYSTIIQDSGSVGTPLEVSSWLLPKDVITKEPDTVAKKLFQVAVEQDYLGYYLVTGGAVANVSADAVGVNPAWRNSAAYVGTGIGWKEGASTAEIETLRTGLKKSMATFESIAPESGAYFNEASRYQPNWKKSFFGSHYGKLRSIKAKYDPDSLFIVWEGVGSDEWDSTLNCRI